LSRQHAGRWTEGVVSGGIQIQVSKIVQREDKSASTLFVASMLQRNSHYVNVYPKSLHSNFTFSLLTMSVPRNSGFYTALNSFQVPTDYHYRVFVHNKAFDIIGPNQPGFLSLARKFQLHIGIPVALENQPSIGTLRKPTSTRHSQPL